MRDSQRDLKADSRSWIMVESRLNHFYFDRPDSELSNLMKWIYSNLEHRESPQENHDSGAWISFRGDSVIQRWFTVPTIQQWIQPSWITSWITSWISRESLTLTVPNAELRLSRALVFLDTGQLGRHPCRCFHVFGSCRLQLCNILQGQLLCETEPATSQIKVE